MGDQLIETTITENTANKGAYSYTCQMASCPIDHAGKDNSKIEVGLDSRKVPC